MVIYAILNTIRKHAALEPEFLANHGSMLKWNRLIIFDKLTLRHTLKMVSINNFRGIQGHFRSKRGMKKIFSLAYRLTDAEIRVGDSKDIRENEICAVISKRPKGMYQTRSYEVT